MGWSTSSAAVLLLIVGCSSSDDEPFTDCAIGELTGTWRITYAETDGNCGPLADETGIFDPNAPPPPGCTYQSDAISADKCRADLALTCPTTDGVGTQAWVIVVKQTAHAKLKGTGTMQIDHPTIGPCRSTYDMTFSKL